MIIKSVYGRKTLKNMTTVMIRQPGYLPYLGFFKKIQNSDIFVFLDDVQFSKGSYENRNKIKTKTGFKWLSVPIVHSSNQKINQIKISNDEDWRSKHKHILFENYHNAPFFTVYWNDIEKILSMDWVNLVDLNLYLIQFFCNELKINTKCILSSKLDIHSSKSQRLLDICQKLNSTKYISGTYGKDYLNKQIFTQKKIDVEFENFIHPIYHQINGKFLSNMSVVDILFNEGENSKKILDDSNP